MKSFLPTFISLALFVASSSAITADIYANANCTGSPQMTMTYTLNVCKDVSQGGFSASMKPTVCNATWASVSSYTGTATCSGSPGSVQTGVPGTCINDGSGGYVKVTCDGASPSSPTIKSSASAFSYGIGALFVIFVGILI